MNGTGDDRELTVEESRPFLLRICALLAAHGVTGAEAGYHGEGSDGAVDEVRYKPEGVGVPAELDALVEDWIDRSLPDGWDGDPGSYGTVTLHVAEGRANFDHTARIESTEHAPFQIEAKHAVDVAIGHENTGMNNERPLEHDLIAPLRADMEGRGGFGMKSDEGGRFLARLCVVLAQYGVATVTVEYSGSGDDGAVGDIDFEPTLERHTQELEDLIENWVDGNLPTGWENNEGGFGTVTINVARRHAAFDHNDWVESSVSNPYEIEAAAAANDEGGTDDDPRAGP